MRILLATLADAERVSYSAHEWLAQNDPGYGLSVETGATTRWAAPVAEGGAWAVPIIPALFQMLGITPQQDEAGEWLLPPQPMATNGMVLLEMPEQVVSAPIFGDD